VYTVTIMVTEHTTSPAQQLREKLAQIQKAADLSDYKFADKLGVDRIVWYTTRTGKRPIGLTLLKAIARVFPELHADVLSFLFGEDHDNSDTIT